MELIKHLTTEEQSILLKSTAMVAVLIAGADDEIDDKEREWAVKLNKYRSLNGHTQINKFYQEANVDFEKQFNELIDILPSEADERNRLLSNDLEKLSEILPKLDHTFAVQLHKSLVTFAESIAKESGGIFGMGSVSAAENKWLDLPMIKFKH